MRTVKDDSMLIPLKLWLENIEDGAMVQAMDLTRLPFAFHHVAIMPDSHVGYGMPIGGVMATNGVIVPNAVGVDIGCGMAIARTPLMDDDATPDLLKQIMGEIRKRVPVGFSHHKERHEWEGFDRAPDVAIIQRELGPAHSQIGTLGGGNHFIEIQRGSDTGVYVMIHSGSRNFGLKIAKDYHDKAKELCASWYSDVPNADLSFLPMDSPDGREYMDAMNFALDFARENRRQMMAAIESAFKEILPSTAFGDVFDIHHNYATMEHHFGKNVMVHRKGAVKAYEGDKGIIPGSQGTASYIVRGLGNPESFMSSSHGAGRRLGRAAAQRTLSLEDEQRKLDELGIIHSVRNVKDLDEAAGAYKDIDEVMANQTDLVEVVLKLTPLAVIKG
jgi:tRNA-splicing ligase RtcB